MQRQFLDAIQMMAASLQSGYSVENAVCASAKELEKLYPRDTFIVLEFQNMALQLDRNQSVESLLQDLGERSQVEDLQSFAEVFLTVKRTGGDLLHVIRNDGAEGDEPDAVTDLAVCTADITGVSVRYVWKSDRKGGDDSLSSDLCCGVSVGKENCGN